MSKPISDLFKPRSDLAEHLFPTPTPPGCQTLLDVPAYTPVTCITVSESSPPAITTASLLVTPLTTVSVYLGITQSLFTSDVTGLLT